MSSFGERLKIAFNNARNAEIARKLRVSEPAIKKYMSGSMPNLDNLIEIKKLTGRSLDWLIEGKEETTSSVSVTEKLTSKLESIAAEQSRILYSDIEIGGGNVKGSTLELLIEFLLARALVSYGLIDDESDVMSSADLKRSQRFAFTQNRPQLLDDRIREMISNAMANETRFTVDTEERFRAIIRELVQEEVSKSRKRPVYPLRVADASTDENLEETTLRKVG